MLVSLFINYKALSVTGIYCGPPSCFVFVFSFLRFLDNCCYICMALVMHTLIINCNLDNLLLLNG